MTRAQLANPNSRASEDQVKALGFVTFRTWKEDGTLAAIQERKNVVCTVGKTAIAAAMTSNASSRAAYIALGTSATTPAASDTILGTEAYRNAVASSSNGTAIAYVTGFFTAAETSGHFYEAGIFIGGSLSSGTGTLLSHVACDVVKSGSETLTVDWSITLT